MTATNIVTIKSFSPMYKEGEEANNIHIVNVEEHDFDVVSQKSLYKIGDKGCFIEPDYCLSNIPLFQSFIEPDGNPNRSKLGKNNRVKAIKFGFVNSKGNKVFSNGILLPLQEVLDYLNLTEITDDINLDELLGITKYEEPESKQLGDALGPLPQGMYMTDETNFNACSKQLEPLLPCQIIGSLKYDGSSESIFLKDENRFGICSRKLEKKLYDKVYPENIKRYFNKETKEKGYIDTNNNDLFIPDEGIIAYCTNNNLSINLELAKDDFVQLGFPILEKLRQYGKPLTVRSEAFGMTLKGSGNKSNPHAKFPKSIRAYGIDDYSKGYCEKFPMKDVIDICKKLDIEMVDIIFNKVFNTIEEIKDECENYFKDNLVEGIVIRTFNSNEFSAKYMSSEYDINKN